MWPREYDTNMITTYNQKGEPIIRLNKDATDMVVFECLECGTKIFIENGIDGCRCLKCGGTIDPIGRAKRKG